MKKIKTTTYNFPVIIEKDEDGFFVADCPELVGCHTQGKTLEEAITNIRDAIALNLNMKLGFRFRDQSGSHAVYVHPDGRRVTIPIHPSDTIGIGLPTKIIKKDLQITKSKFIELLK